MSLREQFTEQLKVSMKAGDAAKTSTLRMIMAKLKDTDIAARPKGIDKVPDEEVLSMLRGMVKSRRESVTLYEQGNRPELAEKERLEITMIEGYLPQAASEDQVRAVVQGAIAHLSQDGQKPGPKDMGTTMRVVQQRLQADGVRADGKLVSEIVKAELAK